MNKLKNLQNQKGVSLIEIMVSVGISVFIFLSLISAFLGVKSLSELSESHLQASLIVRSQMEALRGTPYAQLAAANVQTAYDAGPDGTWGTGDDLMGTLTTTLQDNADFDGDGNTTETAISVDADATNDAVAQPARVTFAWAQRVLGHNKNYTVSADTIFAQ